MKKIISVLMSTVIFMTIFIILSVGTQVSAALRPDILLTAPNQYYVAGEVITFKLKIFADVFQEIDYVKIFIDCNTDVLVYKGTDLSIEVSETEKGYTIKCKPYQGEEKAITRNDEIPITFGVTEGNPDVNVYAVQKDSDKAEEHESRISASLPRNTVFSPDEVPRLIIAGDLDIYRKGDTIYLPHPVTKSELKTKITSTHKEYPLTYEGLFYADSEPALTGDELFVTFDGRQGEKVRVCILGDADYNGIVNAADARKTLRYAAKLESFPEHFSEGCDFNGNLIPEASDARKILRISAKLEEFDNPEITLFEDEKFVIEKLKNAGSGLYNWRCTVSDNDAFEITKSVTPPAPEDFKPGTPFEQTFTFKALKAGTYDIHFELIANHEDEPIDEFYFTATVWLDVPIGNDITDI